MLDFHKENNFVIDKQRQENIVNNYVRTVGDLQQFNHYSIYWLPIQHPLSDSPFTVRWMFYTRNIWNYFQGFCYHLCSSTCVELSMLTKKYIQHAMLASSGHNMVFVHKYN